MIANNKILSNSILQLHFQLKIQKFQFLRFQQKKKQQNHNILSIPLNLQQQIMAYQQPQGRIFTPIRNQPLTGRNANIQPTMFKRKQIFQKVNIERFQTPFSGYSFTGSSVSETNMLARSQVSQFSQESVIKLIKDELQKNGLNTSSQTSQENLKNKNELNILRIQVRSIKESYHELNKSFKKKFQEQNQIIGLMKKQYDGHKKNESINKEEIFGEIDEKFKQMEEEITAKIRQIYTKTQQDLRKQLTNYVRREFVPRSFLDDMDKLMNDLDNRIQQLEGASSNKNNQNLHQSIKVDRDSELKLNKIERDFEIIKKLLDQKSEKIKQLDQLIEMGRQNELRYFKEIKDHVNQSFNELKKENKNTTQRLEKSVIQYKKQMENKIQSQIQSLSKKLEQQNITLLKSISSSVIVQNLSNPISNIDSDFENIKKIESETQNKSAATIFNTVINTKEFIQKNDSNNSEGQQEYNNATNAIQESERQSPGKKIPQKKITITFGGPVPVIEKPSPILNTQKVGLSESLVRQFTESGSNFLKTLNSQVSNSTNNLNILNTQLQASQVGEEEVNPPGNRKKVYKIDRDGYLMDGQNRYLLSSTNSMIKVTQKQIQQIQQTNLLRVEKYAVNKI